MSKKRKRKQRLKKPDNLFWIILLVVIFILFFIYQQKEKTFSDEDEDIESSEQINLGQYKLATFSDSFSSESWLDMEKTSLVFNQQQKSFVFPEPEKDLVGSLSDDSKNKQEPKQVVSKKVNFNVKEIKAVRIDKSENLKVNSQIQYSFSNDGGINWMKTDIGQMVYFQDTGNDLRWRVIISPLSRDIQEGKNLSKISSINLTYWYER